VKRYLGDIDVRWDDEVEVLTLEKHGGRCELYSTFLGEDQLWDLAKRQRIFGF
jgi:hypothetical protein